MNEQRPNPSAPEPGRQPEPASELPRYETPKIEVMSEEDVLRTFQVTHAAISWWVV